MNTKKSLLYKFILSFTFFSLCSALCTAQGNLSICVRDENLKSIPFYSISSVRDSKLQYSGDKEGNSQIPNKEGFSYRVHAVGYIDTIFTIHDKFKKEIILRSNNTLDEIVIKPIKYYEKSVKLKSSSTNEFNWYAAGNASYNHEIGRIISLEKNIWLQTVSFKIKSKYPLEFKKNVFINIYRVTDELDEEIKKLKIEKPSFSRFSSPDLIFSSHLDDNYDVSLSNKFLTFNLSRQGIYLSSGKYIVTMELLAQITTGIKPYFSLSKECFTLRSNNNSKIVTWFSELWEEKYMNLITDLTYYPEKDR